jgi:hypothetical protein
MEDWSGEYSNLVMFGYHAAMQIDPVESEL